MRGHDGRRSGPVAIDEFTWRDRQRLAQGLAAARTASLYRRLEAVLLVAEGEAASAAARRVRVASRSVQRWVRQYLGTRDPCALADRPRPGRPRAAPALTAECLAALLATDPRMLGYRATTWTAPLLAHHLRTCRGLAVSERTLRRRLREHRYRWKRPRYVYHTRAPHVAQKKGR